MAKKNKKTVNQNLKDEYKKKYASSKELSDASKSDMSRASSMIPASKLYDNIKRNEKRMSSKTGSENNAQLMKGVIDWSGGSKKGIDLLGNQVYTPSQTWVFIVAGQSNALHATRSETDETYPIDTLQWGRFEGANNTIIQASVPLQHNLYTPSSQNGAGFVTRFANLIKENNPNVNLLFIPCAEGGTGFKDNRWNKGDDLYEDMVERANLCLSENKDFLFKGMIWHQGETDVISGNNSYTISITNFINNWRIDVDRADSTSPFVCGGMLPSYIAGSALALEINNIIKDVPNNFFYSGFADSESPTVLSGRDTFHFTTESSLTLGDRYYDAYLSALSNTPS